ncbi:MAG: SnoaL-like domain-containing protein, partial [Saprospiraceae bacterium]
MSQIRRLIKNVTIKGQGRMQMDEVAVYEVR